MRCAPLPAAQGHLLRVFFRPAEALRRRIDRLTSLATARARPHHVAPRPHEASASPTGAAGEGVHLIAVELAHHTLHELMHVLPCVLQSAAEARSGSAGIPIGPNHCARLGAVLYISMHT